MRYIFLLCFTLVFIGCSSKEPQIKEEKQLTEKKLKLKSIEKPKKLIIDDLVNIPQDAAFFTNQLEENVTIYEIQKEYEKHYFSAWDDSNSREKLNNDMWPFHSFLAGFSYGENLQLIKQDFFDKILENANFDNYYSLDKKAITLRLVNIRAFPTIKPLLRDPSKAGEGFPFDYLQNSVIHANKPILISHYSKDKAWVFIKSSFASGWIKSSEVVIMEEEHVNALKKAQQIFLIKEDIPLYDADENFVFNSKVGMMLALISEDDNNYTALAVSVLKDNKPLFKRVKISKSIANKNILSINRDSMTVIMSEVMKSNYGWGGMYEQRDCSSTLRDMFTPFGIWLPRNSSQQAKVGKVISLDNLENDEKIDMIKEQGIPFQTLLYKKGHIVLYVGVLDDEIIIFHNTWGIKTLKDGVEGRFIIGKTIFSSLRPGKNLENYDEKGEILRNLKSMNILTQ